MDWAQLAGRLSAAGRLDELSVETDFTPPQPTFPFGAHVIVVEVDSETGSVDLRRVIAVDDAGTIINPMIAEGQVHGGVAAGIAQALFEETAFDAEGNPANANFVTYCIPGPPSSRMFERVAIETPTPVNPLGAKGIGESGTIGSTPAALNAVIDAARPSRRSPHRHARQRRAGVARDPGCPPLTLAQDELEARPEGVRAYRQPQRPGFADCAPTGRVRLDALARWLQDVAYADVEDAGVAQAAVWVVRRTRMRVNRFPRFGERFELMTFCSGLGRMWAERRTDITSADAAGEPADVQAVSLWIHLDPERWVPTPVTEPELAVYRRQGPMAERKVGHRLRHPGPERVQSEREWAFRATRVRPRRPRQQRRLLGAARGGAARRSRARAHRCRARVPHARPAGRQAHPGGRRPAVDRRSRR